MNTSLLRLFIAIDLPSSVQVALEGVQNDLAAQVPRRTVRWTNLNSIHLTLKFLGDTPQQRVDALSAALRQAAANVKAFTLNAGQPGVFPNPKRARIVWVSVGGERAALDALYEAVEQHVTALGFEPEGRAFNPHLTIGRVARQARNDERAQVGEIVSAYAGDELASWTVSSVNLIRSQLKPGGAVYTRLSEIPLEA